MNIVKSHTSSTWINFTIVNDHSFFLKWYASGANKIKRLKEIVFCLKIVKEESMNIEDIGQSDSNKCFMVAIKQKDY